MSAKLLRWFLEAPEQPPVRAQEYLVNQNLAPAVRTHLAVQSNVSYYVSKQETHRVWLTILGPATSVDQLRSEIDDVLSPRVYQTSESDSDKLLEVKSRDYVLGLKRTTDFAIDVHVSEDLPATQRFLIELMCGGAASVEAVHSFLSAHSASYARLSAEEVTTYLHGFYQPGPSVELSFYGHWLWNIVVGGRQPFPGQDANQLINALGIHPARNSAS